MKSDMAMHSQPPGGQPQQRGFSLIMVLLVLVIVSILGVAASQISLMGERGARNDRDMQLAVQSVEAVLLDAENDIEGRGDAALRRPEAFSPGSGVYFADGCGSVEHQKGLCTEVVVGAPAWLAVNLAADSTTAQMASFGDFTGAKFPSGKGVQSAQAPRYLIERLESASGSAAAAGGTEIGLTRAGLSKSTATMYRVTAIGFGPRVEVQSVAQMIYRKE